MRGIVYGCIITVLSILQIIATVRAAFTDPGTVPKVTNQQLNIGLGHAERGNNRKEKEAKRRSSGI